MQKNIYAGLNQGSAAIIAETLSGGFTPANLFKNILSSKNAVSEYFRSKMDIDLLIYDFSQNHEDQSTDETFIKHLEKRLSRLKGSTMDRYMDELKLVNVITSDQALNRIFRNVVGKYLDVEHVREDLMAMEPPAPLVTWAKTEATVLDVIGEDLTAKVEAGEMHTIIGRDEEMMRLVQVLTRQTKANPVLIGEAGVGKTAIAEKLANILTHPEHIPSALHGYRMYEIKIAAIMSADKPEDIVQEMLDVIAKNNIIIFMDEIHTMMDQQGKLANLLKPAMARGSLKLVGATTEDEYKVFEKDKAMVRRFQPVKVDAPDKIATYNILKQKALETEQVHNVIIPRESLLKAIQLSDRYLARRQQPDSSIDLVEEASSKLRMILEAKPEPLVEVLRKISDIEIEIEMTKVQHKGSTPSKRVQDKVDASVKKLVELKEERDRIEEVHNQQMRLIHTSLEVKERLQTLEEELKEAQHLANFEEAIELETVSIPEVRVELQSAEDAILDFAKTTDENLIQNVVVPAMISRIIEDQTGIPVTAQDEDDLIKYREMPQAINKRVRGQERAINQIVQSIQRSKAGLSDPSKPIGSFMCLGPTGVGKTETAKAITDFMFDTEKVLHRFDMSEYMEPHSVSRLFGSPPGYVGHDQGGQLTEEVKRNPYCILLFDEIEKAHSKVFDALLQVLDSGRMTDGKGEVVDFKNTVILMTSNLGSDIIKMGMEQGSPSEVIEDAVIENLKTSFRPEFLNRFDAKVVYSSLTPEVVVTIAENELIKLSDRLIADNEIELHWHPDVPVEITNKAYDANDGARPIQRFINTEIIGKLTDGFLDGSIKKGDMVFIGVDAGQLALFSVLEEELKAIQDSITQESALEKDLFTKTIQTPKVHEDDIVDADVDDDISTSDMESSLAAAKKKLKSNKKLKKLKKKSKKKEEQEDSLPVETGE